MLHVIVSTDVGNRIKKRDALLIKNKGEIISIDDTNSSVALLEQYAFPSLFSVTIPVVHGRYLIENKIEELHKDLLGTLVASPTFFLLEEKSLGTPFLKILEKAGAVIHADKPLKSPAKTNTIFAVTVAITSLNKKERWLSYRKALLEHSVEAIMGILYWKLRSLIESSPKNQSFKNMYSVFMKAHKEAWQKGFPLELAIEKVILEQ